MQSREGHGESTHTTGRDGIPSLQLGWNSEIYRGQACVSRASHIHWNPLQKEREWQIYITKGLRCQGFTSTMLTMLSMASHSMNGSLCCGGLERYRTVNESYGLKICLQRHGSKQHRSCAKFAAHDAALPLHATGTLCLLGDSPRDDSAYICRVWRLRHHRRIVTT